MRVSGTEGKQKGKDQRGEVGEASQRDEQLEEEDLLVEGEEREYVLELLMQEAPPSQHASVHPAKVDITTLRGKRKRNMGKKLRKKLKLTRGAVIKEPRKERRGNAAGGEENQVTSNIPRNPEVKGRGLVSKERGGRSQPAASTSTSGGECSG